MTAEPAALLRGRRHLVLPGVGVRGGLELTTGAVLIALGVRVALTER